MELDRTRKPRSVQACPFVPCGDWNGVFSLPHRLVLEPEVRSGYSLYKSVVRRDRSGTGPCERYVYGFARHLAAGIRRLTRRHRHKRRHQQRHYSDYTFHEHTPVGAVQIVTPYRDCIIARGSVSAGHRRQGTEGWAPNVHLSASSKKRQ